MSDLIINKRLINAPLEEIVNKIKSQLTNGKLKDVQRKGDSLRITCPFHKDGHEEHPSSGLYCGDSKDIEYGVFHCFTCGASGPLWKFVGQCFDRDDEFGKKWLIDNFGDTLVEELIELEEIKLSRTRASPEQSVYLDESILDEFQSYHPYMTERKLSQDVCQHFKVKYDSKTESIVFPVWDETDKLYMLTRRSVNSKKFIIDEAKEKPVYLLNYAVNKKLPFVIVVESQINALTCYSYGLPAVATFGSALTIKQLETLNKSGIKHFIIAFDGDEAGRKGTNKFLTKMRKDIFIDVVNLPDKKDINDLSFDEFTSLLKQNNLDYNELVERLQTK